MTDYTELARRLREPAEMHASFVQHDASTETPLAIVNELQAALRRLHAAVEAAAQPQEPIGYMRPDELRQAKDAPALCRVHPAKDRQLDMVPVFAAAQPAQPQEQREPNRMLCATHYCKDCHALWRENDDFSFSLRSPKCCEACNNAPFGDQLYPLTMVAPKSEPTEAQIEAAATDLYGLPLNDFLRARMARVLRAAFAAKE